MSRTNRNHPDNAFYDDKSCGRDRKPPSKPPKWFKKKRRHTERTQARIAIHQGYEPEQTKHADQWDWN